MASDANQALKFLIHLDARLKSRNPQIQLWERYYEGEHRLQFATSRFRSTFGNLFHEFADNWTELVVDASVERLHINGFRVGDESDEADLDAEAIWRDNYLHADYRIAHTEAVKLGHAYVLVDGENKAFDTDSPLITIEHPTQAIVYHDPTNPRHRLAGLKEWIDEDGVVCATVYLPDAIYRFQAEEKAKDQGHPGLKASGLVTPTDFMSTPSAEVGNGSHIEWIPRKGVPFAVPNPLKVVPLIPLRNNPTLKMGGRSDIAVVIPIQDAVNKQIADMMIASEFASFAQRWATGLEVPKDPQTGRPMDTQNFLASVGRVWASEHPDAKFGQFEASDLKNYVHSIEMLIQHVAALTRTPPHYLLGQSGAFPSGDSLTATETGLVAKVEGKQVDFDPTWGEVQKLAFRALNKEDKAKEVVETLWGDPEQRIRSQRIDGAVKLTTLGVPQQAIWEDELNATPRQVKRWHSMKVAMGLDEHSSEFAVPPPLLEGEKPPTKTNAGPEGNLVAEQAATQATRVSRING
jgi:hypothetical protein